MRKSLLAAAAFTFMPLPALAQGAPEDPAGASGAAGSGDEIVVSGEIDEREIERCRIIRVTGTRFRERVCMTISEVDEQRQNNREVAEDVANAGGAEFQDDIMDALPVAPGD